MHEQRDTEQKVWVFLWLDFPAGWVGGWAEEEDDYLWRHVYTSKAGNLAFIGCRRSARK